MGMRVGYGFDSHAFKAGVPLVIGGLAIEHPEGLNQDGVAVAHATVLLESIGLNEPVARMVAVADVEDEIDQVVKGLVGGARDVSALGRKRPAFDTDDLT